MQEFKEKKKDKMEMSKEGKTYSKLKSSLVIYSI